MVKLIIAVDIDDVLSRSADGFASYSNRRWRTNLTASDYTEEWAVVWNVPIKEALRRAVELHKDKAHSEYLPIDGALPVLQKLSERFSLIAITSRRLLVKDVTDVWLSEHFPKIFNKVYYAGMWDQDGYNRSKLTATKASICQQIGVAYLIDDQLKHCQATAELGIPSLLFGEYTWNRVLGLPKGVTRVKTWQEVEEFFNG